MKKEVDPAGDTEAEKSHAQQLVDYLRVLSEQGIDFEESDLEHLGPMDDAELTEYFFQALLEAGVKDPEEFMIQNNLVEGFRALTSEEFTARNSRELKGIGHKVDELDEQDQQREAGDT
jgi:hypothetical protein